MSKSLQPDAMFLPEAFEDDVKSLQDTYGVVFEARMILEIGFQVLILLLKKDFFVNNV